MAELTLSEIKFILLKPHDPFSLTVDKDEVWKIESAGLGGTNGTISLIDPDKNKVAVLFSSVNQSTYGAVFPYWIVMFKGTLLNESQYSGSVAISVYTLVK
jgi:hypothetical protein